MVKEDGNSFKEYRTLTHEEEQYLLENPQMATRGWFSILRTLIGIIKAVYTGGKKVCELWQNVQGGDPCGTISQQVINSLATNKRYKATSYLKKNMNCDPIHSQQCNIYPNVFWETSLVVY